MTISLFEAIKSLKEDAGWLKKIVIGGLLMLLAQVLSMIGGFFSAGEANPGTILLMALGIILSVICVIYSLGFIVSSANKYMNSEKFTMTEWNEKNLLLTGTNAFFAYLGWGILTLFLLTVASVFIFLIFGLVGVIIFLPMGAIIGYDSPVYSFFILAFCLVAGTISGLYFAQFICTSIASYYKTLKFKDFIAFDKHFNILKHNQHAAWTLIGKNVLYTLLFLVVVIALCVTVIGIVLLPFVYFAAYLVINNLLVQYAKKIEIEKYL